LIVGKPTVLKKASPLTHIVACPDPVPDHVPDPVLDPVPVPGPDPDIAIKNEPEAINNQSDTGPYCSQMSPSPPCDHRKALLPPFWGWFEITNPPYVACIEMEQIGETFIPRKKIVVEGNTLKYLVKDNVAVCSLPTQYSTIKDLTEILKKFNDAGLCEGCRSPELVNIRTSSGWKAEGIVRSKTCTFICDKRVCCQCTLMIKNLKRKAMRSNRTCVLQKLKRSQQVTKNAVRKLERRQSTIEVTFMIVLFENEASNNSIYEL
jgi:hypothetical protein